MDNYLPHAPRWVDTCDVADPGSVKTFGGGRKQFVKTQPRAVRTYKLRWNSIDQATLDDLREFHDDHGPGVSFLINLRGYSEPVRVRFVKDSFRETWGKGSTFVADLEATIETV
jgi:hypothetical protein